MTAILFIMSKQNYILIINAGSSTLKFKVFNYQLKEAEAGLLEGVKNYQTAARPLLKKLKEKYQIKAIGHRIVHGGEDFIKPTIVTGEVLKKLEKYNQLAPLHNPYNLAGVRACQKEFKGVKNIAVFDTAFFSSIPDYVYLYALPLKYYQKYVSGVMGFTASRINMRRRSGSYIE